MPTKLQEASTCLRSSCAGTTQRNWGDNDSNSSVESIDAIQDEQQAAMDAMQDEQARGQSDFDRLKTMANI